ncbi:zinc ribbon-containing protein [Clostridium bowmanii]|nr:zinc ribbon-containing protein [Clostridium bowmanii]MBU3188968.1 zinc ribbon-containing protein [Clostridium bowmanii]MCA1073621.1 zinc ribbon-containing protein [Clostridium bowmanii]
MNTTGQKPGKGDYKCTTCGEIVHLELDSEFLPLCPKCRRTTYEKL